MPWRSGTLLGKAWLALLGFFFVGQADARSRDRCGRRSSETRVLGDATACLGRSVVGSCGARPQGWCVVFEVFSALASVRGLGTGVDVGAAAPKSSSRGVSSLPARADGSSARVVRGLGAGVSRCVVWFLPVFLINWPCGFRVCPSTYPCIGFWPIFLINWSFFFFFFFFLMNRQSSCRLCKKKRYPRRHQLERRYTIV
jgi:hypothetical protein